MSSKTETDGISSFSSTAPVRNILVFHKLSNRFTFGSTNYSPERLIVLLESLIDSGFEFGSIEEVLRTVNSKKLSLTFDDGYAHLMRTLPRLIDKYGIKPVIFLPTAFIGENNTWDYSFRLREETHLDKTQIAELSAMGCKFGTHGHRHLDLTRLDEKTLRLELFNSKEALENITGRTINMMSYPFGKYNDNVLTIVKEVGYESAFTMRFPKLSDNPLTIGRVPVYFFDNPAFVHQKLNGTRWRIFHSGLGRFINQLSGGTTILNRMTNRKLR